MLSRRRFLVLAPLAAIAACSGGSHLAAPPQPESRATSVSPSPTSSSSSGSLVHWPAPPQPLQVSYVGDSVGYRGSFASTRALTWQGRMDTRLRKLGAITHGRYDITPDARRLTLVSGISQLTPGDGLTTVMFGDNDVREGHSPAQVGAEFTHLLDLVRAASPHTTLLVSGLWAPTSIARDYDPLIAAAARNHDGLFVRVSDLYDDPKNRLPAGMPSFGGYHTDGYHPNDTGSLAIYQRFARALRLP
jgi:lysophospholipase L1-like esterase